MPSSVSNIGNASITFGTCEIGSTYGQVEQASLERTVEEVGVPDCHGGLQAMLLLNPGYNFNFTAILPATVALPAEGEPVTFPGAGVIGNIITWTLNWESKNARKISIVAKHWDSIGSNPTVGEIAAS